MTSPSLSFLSHSSPSPPLEMMRNKKKPKFSKFGLGGWVKGENESIESKDIFEFLFPNGWLNNPLYKDSNQDDCDNSNDDDDGDNRDRDDNDAVSTVTAASSVAKNKVPQAFFVVCGECGKHTISNKKTQYGSAVNHAVRTCYNLPSLHKAIRKWRKQEASGRGGGKKQVDLLKSFNNNAKPKDLALFTWMCLVTIHNVPIRKVDDADFRSLLSCSETKLRLWKKRLLRR